MCSWGDLAQELYIACMQILIRRMSVGRFGLDGRGENLLADDL